MSDGTMSDLDERVLSELLASFPVSQSPFCDIGARLEVPEADVLESAERLRGCGAIARIGADFLDLKGLELRAPSQDDMVLAELLSGDLPWSEHPYAEIAALMQERGIDASEEWVLERTTSWVESGEISRIAADSA